MAQHYPTRIGAVAFFDVLGYQNFILHSHIQKAAEIIERVILRLPTLARELITNRLKGFDDEHATNIGKCMGKPINISDSIVWDFSFDSSLKGGLEIQWLTFLGASCLLQQLMFKSGLPLRGAISYGEYYISGNCFAGRPVIEAYELSNKIELVGCGLTLQAERELPRGRVGGIDAYGALLTDYLTPLKATSPQSLRLLNWAFPGASLLEPLAENIRDQIIESFAGHGKPIPVEVSL